MNDDDWRGLYVAIKATDIISGDVVITEALAEFSGWIDGQYNIDAVWIDLGSGPVSVDGWMRDAVRAHIPRDEIELAFNDAANEVEW